LRCCSPLRSAHRGNGVNDKRHRKDPLTSVVLQEALLNMPLSVHIGMRGYALHPASVSACRCLIPLRSIQYRPRQLASRTKAQRRCSKGLACGGDGSQGIECGLYSLRSTYCVKLLEAPRTRCDSLRTCRGERQPAASQHSPPLQRAPSEQTYPTARSTHGSQSRPRESRLRPSPV
jgi:hypothetical protein